MKCYKSALQCCVFSINREAFVKIKMFNIRKAKDEEPTAPGQGKKNTRLQMTDKQ